MVILIAGASHTGKTLLAQRLLEKYHYPYLSLDHLKMGLIRSGQIPLTVFDDEKLTQCLWPIAREIIKTVIENRQNLILEGCYIPFSWQAGFSSEYLEHITCRWLIMTPEYIRSHFPAIRDQASAIEKRLDDSNLCPEDLIRDNQNILEGCLSYGCEYLLIDREYPRNLEDLL